MKTFNLYAEEIKHFPIFKGEELQLLTIILKLLNLSFYYLIEE